MHLPLPRVIGHRGAMAVAPENTLAGIARAKALGATWVEFDVRLTADGACILLHDDDLDRTTDASGEAASLTLAELRRFDAGGWFGASFAGEPIPTFEETIDLLGRLGLGANVEIKPAPGQEIETARTAMAILTKTWPAHLPPPLVSSFKPASLAAAREAAGEIARGLLVEAVPGDWREQLAALGCRTFHCNHHALTAETVAAVKRAGYPVLAYTVNQPARARQLVAWGVDSMFSDVPHQVQAKLGAEEPRQKRAR